MAMVEFYRCELVLYAALEVLSNWTQIVDILVCQVSLNLRSPSLLQSLVLIVEQYSIVEC